MLGRWMAFKRRWITVVGLVRDWLRMNGLGKRDGYSETLETSTRTRFNAFATFPGVGCTKLGGS